MRGRLAAVWESVRSSYWFIPTLMALGSAILAFLSLELEQIIDPPRQKTFYWFYTGGSEGSRHLLSTIAASVITVAGTAFSITIAALSLASTQFGPRILRSFMADTGNQIVLGTFTSTFLYCILILRTVRSGDASFVPHVATTIAVLLAICSVAVLIYFIHHAARSIQVSHVIEAVGQELRHVVERLFPERIGEPALEPTWPNGSSVDVISRHAGYLQEVSPDEVLATAERHDLVIDLLVKPGDHITAGRTIATCWGTESEEVLAEIRGLFVLGPERTSRQDCEYAFLQLAEVAVRALSPGINDPFTACMCVDKMTEALTVMAKRHLPCPLRRDPQGTLRVRAALPDYRQLVAASMGSVRQYGKAHPMVLERIDLQLRQLLSGHVYEPEFRQALEEERARVKAEIRSRPAPLE